MFSASHASHHVLKAPFLCDLDELRLVKSFVPLMNVFFGRVFNGAELSELSQYLGEIPGHVYEPSVYDLRPSAGECIVGAILRLLWIDFENRRYAECRSCQNSMIVCYRSHEHIRNASLITALINTQLFAYFGVSWGSV